jgi:hypothetical protein
VAPERNREADESEIIHDTKIVSQVFVLDIGQIATPVKHCETFSSHHAQRTAREPNKGGFRP